MADLVLRAAASADWPEIARCLAEHDLPLDGAEAHLSDFHVAIDGAALVGVAGFETHGDATGLMRSVAVAATHRRWGLGARLVDATIDAARTRGIRALYLLTTTAAPYFARRGFIVVAREGAPRILEASAEFRGACPATATLMRLEIA